MKIAAKISGTLTICLAAALLAAGAMPANASPAAPETTAIVKSEQPAVEVVFVLDTTGSMSGLIDAAKDKIWSIANTLASADPAPAIRMGLVGYRDRGDAYVTALTDLSDDLDAVYTQLMQYCADGGGDGPESVNQALYEAVTKTAWSRQPGAYRVIFLVGDAPPHMDYQNDVKYAKSCRLARERGIVINTIQCGAAQETVAPWQAIARLGAGEYFRVAQTGSAVRYDTPFDKKIAALSRALDETRMYYGAPEKQAAMEERQRAADKIYAEAAPAAVAKRTVFNSLASGAKNFLGDQELVDDVGSGKVKLEALKEEELPEALKPLSPAERQAAIDARLKTRTELQAKIGQLARERQDYIEKKVADEAGGGKDSLDAKIYSCIRSQAGTKGIAYKEGPAY
jgi:Mg-chelatase subunit ChlD